jgi:hypothetical protein
MARITERQYWRRPARLALYPISALILVLMVFLVNAANTTSSIECSDPTGALPDLWIFGAGVAAAVVGRYAAWPRYEPVPPEEQGKPRITEQKESRLLGAVGLAGFFFAAAAALYFEAVAVQSVGGVAPITHYIRCAVVYDKTGSTHGVVTFAAVMVVCYLAGHWLWTTDRGQPAGPK